MPVDEQVVLSLQSQVGALLSRVNELEEWKAGHEGIDVGVRGLNYPHPNQKFIYILLAGSVGDFTSLQLIDGMIGYNLTSDKFTGRASDATVNFAMEAWVTTNFPAVTLAADADALLGLTGQQLTLDTQTANLILAGPVSGAAADPTFRALVDADIPAAIARDAEVTSEIGTHAAAADPHTGYVREADVNWTDLTDSGATTLHSHAGGAGMSLLVKEANETVNNSSTMQNDDELLFAIAANEVWQFEGVLFITSTTATPDFRIGFTGPAGAVGSFGAILGDTATGNADAGSAALGTAVDFASANVFTIVRFWGGIHNGANAGNLTLQWAQSAATAENTTVRAGSYIKYQIET